MMLLRNLAVLGLTVTLVAAGPVPLQAQTPDRIPRRGTRPVVTRQSPGIKRSQLAHVIEPPDLVLVEVIEALPGRPISGERLVRPDGTISLGFYGDVEVAGLTISEAKEKIVKHLMAFLDDKILGLFDIDPETGDAKKDENGEIIRIEPRDTDRVFIDVTAYHSKNYYVYGWVYVPGRLPITGNDTVLDAIIYCGGLRPEADPKQIYIMRSFPKGSPVQKLHVNYEQIVAGTDWSTNYLLAPDDRILIHEEEAKDSGKFPENRPRMQFQQSHPEPTNTETTQDMTSALERFEKRLAKVEETLERVLKKLEEVQQSQTEETNAAKPHGHDPFGIEGPTARPTKVNPFDVDGPGSRAPSDIDDPGSRFPAASDELRTP
jgi:polysaccharide export outer membrane protein